MRSIQIVTVVVFSLGALIFTYSHAPQRTSQPTQTATQARPSKPVKARKVLVKELPKEVIGVELKDGVFRLKQGYKFVNQTTNTVAVIRAGGSGVTGSFDCSCNAKKAGDSASGTCSLVTSDSGLACYKDDKDTCTGDCKMATIIRGQRLTLALY